MLGRDRAANPRRKHFLILGPESGRFGWLKKVRHLQKNYNCQWAFLRGKDPKCIFHNLGNLRQPLASIPTSRERVLPTEWHVRTILGDCISKAKVITVQELQFRQYALISDFLDLAHLSVQEEAALATNWIKDRPEGLKLQKLVLATMTGPVLSSSPRNLTSAVQYAIDRCKSMSPGKRLIPHENNQHLQGIFPRIWQSFDVIFCRICTSIAVCCFKYRWWKF